MLRLARDLQVPNTGMTFCLNVLWRGDGHACMCVYYFSIGYCIANGVKSGADLMLELMVIEEFQFFLVLDQRFLGL